MPFPATASAQWTGTTLTFRVEASGLPAAGVDISVVKERSERRIATTGRSGLAGIDLRGVDIAMGERVSTLVIDCEGELAVQLVPASGQVDVVPEGCERRQAGAFFWGRTERVVIRVDAARAWVETAQAKAFSKRLSGPRLTLDFLYAPLYGFEDGTGTSEYNAGFGAMVRGIWLWSNGLGVGAGGSFSIHDVGGIDEDMSYWSAFVEPRYTFLLGVSKIRPHVLARVSYNWFHYENTPSGVPGGINQAGWGFGAGAGVAYPVFDWVGIEGGVYYGSLAMDYSGFEGSRSGSGLQLTAGVRFF